MRQVHLIPGPVKHVFSIPDYFLSPAFSEQINGGNIEIGAVHPSVYPSFHHRLNQVKV